MLNDIIKGAESEFDQIFNSAEVYHVGGLFNGNTPVEFESETQALNEIKKLLYPEIKSFLSTQIRQAVTEAVKSVVPEYEKTKGKKTISKILFNRGYNMCRTEIEQRITNLLQ